MSARSAGTAARRKGLRGERDVADLFDAAGFECRGLEGLGDWLAIRDGLVVHVEVKRQERLKLPEWLRQAADEAPAGVPPVVVFRQNRGEWYVALRLADYLERSETP